MRRFHQWTRYLPPWMASPGDALPFVIAGICGVVRWFHVRDSVLPLLAYFLLLTTCYWFSWWFEQQRHRRDGDQSDGEQPEDPDGPGGAQMRARLANWRHPVATTELRARGVEER